MEEFDGWFTIEGNELLLEVSCHGGTVWFCVRSVECDGEGEVYLDSGLCLREMLALLGLTPGVLRGLGDEMEQADAAGYILRT